MKLSQKAEYALRAMLELSRRYEKGTIRTSEIARRQAIPEKFLEVILVELRRGGFLASVRGPIGGHKLARDPRTISVGEIWRAIDGEALARSDSGQEDPYAFVWGKVEEAVSKVVDHVTLEDVRQRTDTRQGVPDFNI